MHHFLTGSMSAGEVEFLPLLVAVESVSLIVDHPMRNDIDS